MIANVLRWIGDFFQNLFASVLDFLSNMFGSLFNGLMDFLRFLFRPILIVIALLFLVIYKIAELIVLLLSVLLMIGKLVYSFVMGLFKTLGGLIWSSATPNHGSWGQPIREVFNALAPYQLDKIAYVLMFVIWVLTAYSAIKILSARGAEED